MELDASAGAATAGGHLGSQLSTSMPTMAEVRIRTPVGEEAGFEEILLATKLGQESRAAATYAISLAEEFHAKLTLLHVMNEEDFDLPADPQVALRNRTERLRKIVPADADLACKLDCVVEFGNGAEQILRVARERSPVMTVCD